MENKLQELTRKIYEEGIEKAQLEAAEILAAANRQAGEITSNARREAESILSKAQREADELQRNAQSELAMSSKQALSAIRQQISHLITAKVVDAPVKQALSDKLFITEIIRKALEGFGNNATLILPAADEYALESYFGIKVSEVLKSGVEITFDDKIKGGFKIGPLDKSYVISFTDDDFTAFFKSFMRPRTLQLLFDND